MAVTNINQILEWFKTGKKPTQAQFWATWGSFWHKHEGVVVKHPTQNDIDAGLKTMDVLTNGNATTIPTSGGYGGSMMDLKNFFGNKKATISYRDLAYGESYKDFCSDIVPIVSVSVDKFFNLALNELVIFKEATKSNPALNYYDGFVLHLFTKSGGKFGLSGPVGSPNHTADIQPITTGDFVKLDSSLFAGDISLQNINFQTLVSYFKLEDFSATQPTVQQAVNRIFKDGMSKLNLPKLEFFWGHKPYWENDLRKRLLGVKIPFWQNISDFRSSGGRVYLELWRRKETKKDFTSTQGVYSPFRPDSWYLESKPELQGRTNSIEVLNGTDYYKFSFEEYFRGHRRNHKPGKFPSDTDGNSDNKRTYLKARYGFRLRFEGAGINYRTPILGEIYCQINQFDKYLSFKRI